MYIYAALDTDIRQSLLGVLSSHSLRNISKRNDGSCYVVITNLSREKNENYSVKGHYIVLTDCENCFEIFDPLSNFCLYDRHVRVFALSNRCSINKTAFQSKKSKCCSWFCLFYLLLRCKELTRAKRLQYLKSLSWFITTP